MLERDIEAYLVHQAKLHKGEARKIKWQGLRSAPDRIVHLPRNGCSRGATFYVEVKRPGAAATFPSDSRERAQAREHARLRAAGATVYVVDSFDRVDEVINKELRG